MATEIKKYHIFVYLVVTSMVALLGAGCGTTQIFRANFDSDRLHETPNPSPPGDPDSDYIFWYTADSDLSVVSVVYDGVLASNSVRFPNIGGNNGSRYIGFIPIEVSPSATHVYAYWNGVAYISDEPIDIWLGWSYSRPIGGFRLHNGNILIRNSTGGFERIGTFDHGKSQFVLLAINKNSRTFDLTFIQGDNIVTRLGVEAIDTGAVDGTRPVLGMGYINTRESHAFYVADNIIISEEEPEMP